MLSSDQNIESIAQLVRMLRRHALLEGEYVKFDITERIGKLLSGLTLAVVSFVLGIAILFFLTFSAVHHIEPLVGLAWGYSIASTIFIILLWLVVANRHRWIERPLVRFMMSTMMGDKVREEIKAELDTSREGIAATWHGITTDKPAASRGEMVGNLVSRSIVAWDAFMTVRKLMKLFGFPKKRKRK